MNRKTTLILLAVCILLLGSIVAVVLLTGDNETPGSQSGGQGGDATQHGQTSNTTDTQSLPGDIETPVQDDPLDVTVPFNISMGVSTEGRDEKPDETQSGNNLVETDPLQPSGTTPPTEQTKPSENVDSQQPEQTTYEEFLAMNTQQRTEFINSFASDGAFVSWFCEAKAAYESGTSVEIGDGVIDMEDLLIP